jgi:hypothetical protein
MAYGVIVESRIAAQNNDALVRDGVHATEVLENGFVVQLLTKSTTAGEGEVWAATAPVTGSLVNLYMVSEPPVVEIVSADGNRYKGLNPDPRNFAIPALRPFSAFKPQPGDLVLMSADVFSNAKSTNGFANAANTAYQLAWGATQTADALSFKFVEAKDIAIGNGALGSTQRVTAYLMECIAN